MNTQQEFDIPFILGEETRPKIEIFTHEENTVQIPKSIFYKQYCMALAGIAELVNYQGISRKEDDRLPHNNIFVFTGDRGAGKTSCMLTVKELLCKDDKYKEQCYAELQGLNSNLKETLQNTSFQHFDTIDPIYFDCQHNILDLFIGMLFKHFHDYMEEWKGVSRIDRVEKETLLRLFGETKRNLSVLNKTVELSEFDDLEQLSSLAASISFKKSLDELVQQYIKCRYTSGTQLVLCLDDIDLNISEGYEMIEQIRKYLNIKGLIILMAVKIDQLGNVIRIKYAKDFDSLLNRRSKGGMSKRYEEIINEIVERYITKVFPGNHRIQMPTVSYLLDQRIGIFQYTVKGKLERIEIMPTLKVGLLKLIYRKVRLLAYNSRSRVNYIIPQNLRELLNFIHLMYSMEDAPDHVTAIPNLIRFKSYFYEMWCANNLDEEGYVFMRNTQNIHSALNVNQMVIRLLEQRFSIFEKLKSGTDPKDNSLRELINILDAENIMYNISLGDVLACLDWLDKVCNKEKDLKLIFAIKIFYSIYLYEGFRTSKEIQDQKAKFEAEIINRELLTNNETDYGDVLNGNFFNSEYINAMPYENGEISRSRRGLNNSKIKEYYGSTDQRQREIADFFILTTAFVFDSTDKPLGSKDNSAFSKYRKKEEVYYERAISSNRKYICFDVLSIFYNLLDIEKTYKRYDTKFMADERVDMNKVNSEVDEILAKCKKLKSKEQELLRQQERTTRYRIENSPLYGRLLNGIQVTVTENTKCFLGKIDLQKIAPLANELYCTKEEILLYTLNIRNVEILEQISYRLQRTRPDGSSDNIALLRDIFKSLSEYKIKTYDDSDIDFTFFRAICNFLNELSEEQKGMFNGIYTEKESSSDSNKSSSSNSGGGTASK